MLENFNFNQRNGIQRTRSYKNVNRKFEFFKERPLSEVLASTEERELSTSEKELSKISSGSLFCPYQFLYYTMLLEYTNDSSFRLLDFKPRSSR